MKTLGVHAESRPTIKNLIVEPADFLIGGLNCQTERKYDKAFSVRGIKEFQDIFGYDINSSYYGPEEVEGFFSNVSGIDATLYISSYIGNVTGTIDAVIASTIIQNQTPATLLTIKAGYQTKSGGALEYGLSGNRTGVTLTNGARFTTSCLTTGLASDTWIYLTSVSDIKVGDTLKIMLTDGGAATVYKVVTAVDESTGKVDFVAVIHATKKATALDVVTVMGIKIQVWRKNIKGVVSEVDKELGKIYCSINSLVSDYYVENVFSTSKWIDITRAATTPATPDVDFPADITTVTYLTAGVDGTAGTTAAHWNRSLTKLDNLPVRLISNPETTLAAIQLAGETYCRAREDMPKWICNIADDRTKAQLITIGNNFQRSDDVLMAVVADWVRITDPFSTSDNAQPRVVPNVGFVMGVILRTIGIKGIHYIPQKDTPIYGIIGVDNDNLGSNISDRDRTDIAEAGVNIIQHIKGYGYIIRNLFTPSTSLEFKFFNAIMMREYIKISTQDSLQSDENQPNTYDRILKDKDAETGFMRALWNKGSTGNVKTGETFGQGFDSNNKPTKFDDHVLIVADMTNNTQAQINQGERYIDTYFSYPAPTGRIVIGVGIWLK